MVSPLERISTGVRWLLSAGLCWLLYAYKGWIWTGAIFVVILGSEAYGYALRKSKEASRTRIRKALDEAIEVNLRRGGSNED